MDAGGIFLLALFQLGQAGIVGLDSGHIRVDLGLNGGFLLLGSLFQLAKQRAVGFAERVFTGAQVAGLGDGGAVLRIKLQHLVHQRQTRILELLAHIFLDELRILPDKFDIQHVSSLLYLEIKGYAMFQSGLLDPRPHRIPARFGRPAVLQSDAPCARASC